MTDYDLFNGDADGICALLQLRFAEPRPEAIRITGVKRDIKLMQQLEEVMVGDHITVLDISLDKNRDALERVLRAGAEVTYFDHHYAGEIPQTENLTAHINISADVCTSMLVNAYLQDAHLLWAVVGTFGDNLNISAEALAQRAGCTDIEIKQLKELGILINYNGYGASLEDLHFAPDTLYQKLSQFEDPRDFCTGQNADFLRLKNGYAEDMATVRSMVMHYESRNCRVLLLPNEAWARRTSGVYSNELANEQPDLAHAVITQKADGNYLVSVRAPLSDKTGADEFCRQYPSGGGRAAAAGINDLSPSELNQMVQDFDAFYSEKRPI